VLGQSNYALLGDGCAVVRYSVAALDHLGIVDLKTGKLDTLDLPFVSLSSISLLSNRAVLAIAASRTEEAAVVSIDLATRDYKVLRAPGEIKLDSLFISRAEALEFPTEDGRTAHAFFYPPAHADYSGAEGERPPLVVKVHGGPTNHSKAELSLATQFWTTRGFAFLDVNHGGSSGFGRAYRERLNGNWGVVDVADVVAAVKYLASQGRIDINRVAIRGGSAGGFTVLAALAFHDVFKAGANYYGVSDLEALARDTHKFESRYLDGLVAPWPDGRSVYEARSPIHHLESFRAPLITFQGSEDKVVPPSQSRAIVEALQRKGVPVAYIEYEGEQHGFRKAESIVSSLEAELAFYGQVFGFTPAAD
jgi:dipeptidyl aminopeptidase/acylaminoacyl peptidase